MKDISMNRIFRWTLASIIIFTIYALIFNVGIGSAEIGSILIIDDDAPATYDFGNTGFGDSTDMWTKIIWDSTNYNNIGNFRVKAISGETLNFVNSFESTSFNISSGGTGTGNMWYDKNASAVYYVFNANDIFTSSPLILTFQKNIFLNISETPSGYSRSFGGEGVSPSKPLCLGVSSNTICSVRLIYEDLHISVRATDYYNVSYPFENFFSVSILKNPSINTKYIILGSVSEYSRESTFNKINIDNAIFEYNDGIYLNATLSSGVYTKVLVNSSGSGIPTPAPTPVVNPITGKGIIWDKSNYTLGETGTLSWAIADSIWNLFSTQTVVIKKTDSGDVFTSVSSIAPQTGSYQFLFSNCASNEIICGYGTYQGIIYTNLFGLFETNREIATTQVFPASSSYILINSSVPIKTNITATIFIGQGGVLFGTFKTQFLQADNTYIDDRIWSTTLISGTQNRTISFSKIGTYRLVVDDGGGGKLATKLITTFSSSVVPPYNVATSRIRLDRTAYNFDEILTGGYEVDNTNYSTGFPTYVDVFNYDINSITAEFYGQGFGLIPNWADTSLQVGSVGIPIQDSAPQKGFQGIRFVSGNNTIRLRINNVTSGISSTLAFYNFTISKLNVNGYSLEIIPNSVLKGTSVKISYVIPSASTITILSPSGKETNNAVAVSGAITYVPKELGAYYVYLKDSTNTIQVSRTLNVNAAPTISPTPSPDRGAGGILTIFDGWVALLGFGVSPLSKFFFAWLITTIFIVGGFATGRGMAAGTLLGAGAWGWFMAIGYLPQWFVIIVVLQLVLASRWFR